jgi:cobalt/nickel transport system permease protein
MHLLEYYASDHWLSRSDARIKLLVAMIVLVMVLSYQGIGFQLIVTALSLTMIMYMKVPWRLFLLRFSEPLLIVLIVFLLKVFFSGHEPLFSLDIFGFQLTGYREGLREGIAIGSRIMAAISLMAVLVYATPFPELMAALSWLKVPQGFIEILLYAYRYIFVLFEEAMVIYQAQKNRLGYANFQNRFSSFGILTGSLILKAYEQSQTLSTAMVQRGYDGNMPLLQSRPFRTSEIFLSGLVVTVMGILWRI